MGLTFPCTKCGACCKNVSGLGLPVKAGTAECIALGPDNECTVYEQRPILCRVDKIYDRMFSASMTEKDFFKMTADACNRLIEIEGMTPDYKVRIDE
jgi:hypothetical protein